MEFITLYTPPEHTAPMEELRRLVAPSYPDLMSRSNKMFWQRKAGVVKAHMLLLAHLERLGPEVPAQLQADLKFVRSKSLLLLEEMLKLATIPRTQAGTGWMTPSLACVEMMQCIAQAVPTSVRKPGGKADSLAPLLQLPGINQGHIKNLRKRKINTLADLQALPDSQRAIELQWAGMGMAGIEGVNMFLSAMPRLLVTVRCEVEGEDEIMVTDPVHCRVRVLVSRPSHMTEGYQLRGSAVQAYTPNNPVPRDESWYIFLTEPSTNSILAWTKANLMEAERQGIEHPEAFKSSNAAASNGDVKANTANGESAPSSKAVTASNDAANGDAADDPEVVGQEVDLVFAAPKAATYNLNLVVMSNCWIGADETLQLRLRVAPLTRAAAEGRELLNSKAARQRVDDSEGDEDDSSGDGSTSGSGSDEDEDYDSEETGEEESEAASDSSDSSGSSGSPPEQD
eukprot:GHRR01006515.1.p1 GENE.GHRR01006515.1~~GHRR01006515.1.p1  ORF type:complete len:456 (+),score=176.99 GHRR01006515.1:409-1776(+)